MDHLVPLVADQACGDALTKLITTIARGDVSERITDLLSSATLRILLKKEAETMAAMKEALGADYVQPQRPLGMGSILVKIESNCALILPRGSLGVVVGPFQFSVEAKGGRCDLIQWALQMAMELNMSMPSACLDGINSFDPKRYQTLNAKS